MSIKRYEEYQNTSVTWASKIPKHWELLPTKRAFRRKKETNSGMKVENRLALTMKGVLRRSLDDLDGLQASEFDTYQIFQKGDLAFKLIDLQNIKTSRVGIVPEEGIMSPAYIRLEGTGRIEPKYAYWYFMKLYHECIFNELGGGVRQTIGPEELLSLPLAYPTKGEQHAIADFLDRETAKIDALIAEQKRLIELLQEKRQAVISHAVTKGLNPNAPMKDSGVEWLGEVPEHWEVGPVKRFFTSMNYKRIPLSSEERSTRQGEYPYYGASGVIDSIDEYLFDEPLVLVSEDGANLLMRSTPIAFVARGKYWVNNHAHILKPKDGLPVFWSERIESLQIAPFVTGSAQPKLTAEALMNLIVAAPPEEGEKEAIDRRIQEAKEDFAPLLNTSRDAIALLQERRSALISAAVTGQIDVRGLATEEEP